MKITYTTQVAIVQCWWLITERCALLLYVNYEYSRFLLLFSAPYFDALVLCLIFSSSSEFILVVSFTTYTRSCFATDNSGDYHISCHFSFPFRFWMSCQKSCTSATTVATSQILFDTHIKKAEKKRSNILMKTWTNARNEFKWKKREDNANAKALTLS